MKEQREDKHLRSRIEYWWEDEDIRLAAYENDLPRPTDGQCRALREEIYNKVISAKEKGKTNFSFGCDGRKGYIHESNIDSLAFAFSIRQRARGRPYMPVEVHRRFKRMLRQISSLNKTLSLYAIANDTRHLQREYSGQLLKLISSDYYNLFIQRDAVTRERFHCDTPTIQDYFHRFQANDEEFASDYQIPIQEPILTEDEARMALEYDLPKWNGEQRSLLNKQTGDRLKRLRESNMRAFDLLERLNGSEDAPVIGGKLVTDAEPGGFGTLVRVKWRLCEEEFANMGESKGKQVAKALELLKLANEGETCYVVESSVQAHQVTKNPASGRDTTFAILDADIRVL